MGTSPDNARRTVDWKIEAAAEERARLDTEAPKVGGLVAELDFSVRPNMARRIAGAESAPADYVESTLRMEGLYVDHLPPRVWAANLPPGGRLVQHGWETSDISEVRRICEGRRWLSGYIVDIIDSERVELLPIAKIDVKISSAQGRFERGMLKEVLGFDTKSSVSDGFALVAFGPK